MPEEQTTEGQENTTQSDPEFTMDDLFQIQVSQEELKEAEKEMILPVGTYTTEPEFAVTLAEKDGRKYARLWGTVLKGDVKGKIGYPLSWERRNKIDRDTGEDTGKPDYLYRNFVMANKAFSKANDGAESSNPGEVLSYLRDFPHRLRVIHTADNEPLVVSISAVQ